jgi:hypothetical protein
MKYEVDEAIIKSATRCKRDHACLKDTDAVLCEVDPCLMHRVYFINSEYEESCPYMRLLNDAPVCICPVRMEIFDRYGD